MTDEKTQQLENRIDKLESTIEKMMPSRRDALKMGGAALVGGAAMSGTASAGTNQVGTIGSQASPVDLQSEDINNADTVTTENLVVNNTATGPFGGGAPVLEPGDNITIVNTGGTALDTDETYVNFYSGTAKDVIGGTIVGALDLNFLYTFSDNSTFQKGGTGTTYQRDGQNFGRDFNGDPMEVCIFPPARDVIDVKIGAEVLSGSEFGAEIILKG